jgi:oligopeptide/dipeptide ABC transporter ATP-binding protein
VLIGSLPSFERQTGFVKIRGNPHSPLNQPSGCVFHPRCPKVMEVCPSIVPALREVQPARPVACHLYGVVGEPVEPVEPVAEHGRTTG